MSHFFELSPITSSNVNTGYGLPVYPPNSSTGYQLTISGLISVLQTYFTKQDYITTIVTPADGFNIEVTNDGFSRWLIIRPIMGLNSGTIQLPEVANCVDGQELLFTTTYSITSFTVVGNGASEVNGVPTVLSSGDNFKLRFNKQTLSWYSV